MEKPGIKAYYDKRKKVGYHFNIREANYGKFIT